MAENISTRVLRTGDYSCTVVMENKPKGKDMSKQEKIEQIEATIVKLQKQVEDLKKVEYYPCVTPVDEDGNIWFNNNTQCLFIGMDDLWCVKSDGWGGDDCSKSFVWVPCKREDLKAGDTAYRTDHPEDVFFNNKTSVCKVLGEGKIVYISSNGVFVTESTLRLWHKLVRKDTLGE